MVIDNRENEVSQRVQALIGSVEGAIASFFNSRDLEPARKLELIEQHKLKIKFDDTGRLMPVFHDCVIPTVLLKALTAIDVTMQEMVNEYGPEIIPKKYRITEEEKELLSNKDLTLQIEEEE
ncbi:MAG: hypothetical protein US42_C0006G0023 [Candidatus Magasanikbacteria bacterium GW2011_GWC2_37_14]|uniref:Uncharacterized protein n=1 Tax=Candidatus Magasanikbacteria bacterium GW2011_GWC2_37_14 TaxID=1619046 RepID=A0A0G0JI41_9BACT|nr:MAG: hypothetical protein US42_C0006G0023 [Candidatus Magasanikbacteria bacterium GW2011_GWC2_37_14]